MNLQKINSIPSSADLHHYILTHKYLHKNIIPPTSLLRTTWLLFNEHKRVRLH
jgi:hypothetical protein